MSTEPIRVFARVRPLADTGAPGPASVLSPSLRANALASPRGAKAPARAPKPGVFVSMRVGGAVSASGLPTVISFDDGRDAGDAGVGASEDAAAASFDLDGVFDAPTTQAALFSALGAPAVASVLQGFNACVLAYGRSGSGKTHTVLGPTSLRRGDSAWTWGELERERAGGAASALGLVPRAIAALLGGATAGGGGGALGGGFDFSVRVAVAEVYNNRLFDLLKESQEDGGGGGDRVEVPQDGGRLSVSCVDRLVSWHDVGAGVGREASALAAARQFILRANAARVAAATTLNADSSRSHVLYLVRATSLEVSTGATRTALLSIVDLAGSETLDLSPAAPAAVQGMAAALSPTPANPRAAETRAINSSLHVLTRVVSAFATAPPGKRPAHVPFRESLLTLLLKDSIGGNSRTVRVDVDAKHAACHRSNG